MRIFSSSAPVAGWSLRALAAAYPRWRFTGIDPAGLMLELAAGTMGSDAGRADLIEGGGVNLFYAAFTWRGWVGYA